MAAQLVDKHQHSYLLKTNYYLSSEETLILPKRHGQ